MGGFGRRMGSREYKAFLSATVSPPQLPAGSPSSFLWMGGFLLMVTPPPPSPPKPGCVGNAMLSPPAGSASWLFHLYANNPSF